MTKDTMRFPDFFTMDVECMMVISDEIARTCP